jgi:hypothetical protein
MWFLWTNPPLVFLIAFSLNFKDSRGKARKRKDRKNGKQGEKEKRGRIK